MSTYEQLRDRALSQVGCLGQAEAQTIAQIALEEAMRFVAHNIRIPSLIVQATQVTAPADPDLEANAISLTGGAGTFGITSGVYQSPDRLFVKKNSATVGYGAAYTFMQYHHFLDLSSLPAGSRYELEPASYDERPSHVWTITPSDKVWVSPIAEDNVVTLFYRKAPAAYSGAVTPEILPLFDYILVNGAVLALKEWLRDPEVITTMWSLFQSGLEADMARYEAELQGQRKRAVIKPHRAYSYW